MVGKGRAQEEGTGVLVVMERSGAAEEEGGGCGAGGAAPGREEEEGPEHDAAAAPGRYFPCCVGSYVGEGGMRPTEPAEFSRERQETRRLKTIFRSSMWSGTGNFWKLACLYRFSARG